MLTSSGDNDDDDRIPMAIPLSERASETGVSNPVPLTVLCGWLGSGKTTLLKRCIAEFGKDQRRLAVVQNEFSDAGVEDATVMTDDGTVFSDFIELANGCICCTVRNDFVTALEQLVKMDRFDHIILECSGLADPGELASIFWVDSELEIGVKLDAIITLVDAKHLPDNLSASTSEAKSIRRQIGYADRIVLNKLDLVEQNDVEGLHSSIKSLNQVAPILHSVRSDVPLEQIIGINAFAPDAAEAIMSTESCGCAHGDTIDTIVCGPFENEHIDLPKLNMWLADVLWNEHSFTIYRLKGVIFTSDEQQRRFYLQAVQKLFETAPGTPWNANEKPFSKFVIIGLNLSQTQLEEGVRACLIPISSD